jgi:hypothetical protein
MFSDDQQKKMGSGNNETSSMLLQLSAAGFRDTYFLFIYSLFLRVAFVIIVI